MRRSKLNPDEHCTVGTGALIIFIAMVLLACIISFTVISITEQISQNAQGTAEDVRRDSANSVIITGAWVYDNYDDMLFMMEFGGAGDPLAREEVEYVLTCTEPDGTFNYRSSELGNSGAVGGSALYVWEVGTPGPDDNLFGGNINNFQPGGRYFFTLDGGTQTNLNGDECGPVHLDTHEISANLYLHIPNGMSTHQILTLSNGREIGSQLI
jgi:hypothetical protein